VTETGDGSWVFRGGFNLPRKQRGRLFNRVNATAGGGCLTVWTNRAEFSSRTTALPLDNYVTTVERSGTRVARKRGIWRHGVRFDTVAGEVLYFWTYRPGPLLRLLKELGYQVDV
jgi:hypothetical protein